MKYNKTVNANGLRVITVPRSDSKAVTIMVVVKVGSRHETAKINGISHFVEHMMFKGTAKRPTTLEISKALDSVGAEYNAFTAKDHTGYYIKVDRRHINLALDIISDMLINSKFDSVELEREKGVIVEEINMYEDNPLMYVEELLEQLVYGKNDKLGRLISGSRQTVRGLTRADLVDYVDKYYSSDRTVVVAAGAVDDKVQAKISKLFSNYHRSSQPEKFSRRKITQTKPRVSILKKKTEQIQLGLGFPGVAYNDSRRYAVALLRIIMGGNMSSRLFISIRERQGLAYYIKADHGFFEDTGLFYVQAGLDKSRLELAIAAILKEINEVKKKGVNLAEVKKAKDFLQGKIVLDLDDSSNIASWFARQEAVEGKSLSPEEHFAFINKVKPKDIQKAAQQLFIKNKLNLALIGPVSSTQSIKKVIQ